MHGKTHYSQLDEERDREAAGGKHCTPNGGHRLGGRQVSRNHGARGRARHFPVLPEKSCQPDSTAGETFLKAARRPTDLLRQRKTLKNSSLANLKERRKEIPQIEKNEKEGVLRTREQE